MTHFTGTAGDDTITGTTKNDVFDMSQGGNDTVSGLGGKDVFYFGAAFTADDHIDGGTKGNHHHLVQGTVELNGDYSTGVVFGAQTMVNIATLRLDGGHSYNLTINQTTVSSTSGFTVDASTLGAGDSLIFDGSADTSGQLKVVSRAGHVDLTSAAFFTIFDLGSTLNAGDKITGHSGASQTEVDLSGDYSAGMVLDANLMTNVTTIAMSNGTFNFTTADDLVAAGGVFQVFNLGGATVNFNGSAETDGHFNFESLSGTITGSAGNDVFFQNSGTMTSGAGNDQFINCAGTFHLEQSGVVYAVSTINSSNDTFYLGASLTAADQINAGTGTDTVVLNGDYSGGLVLGSATLLNIELLQLTAGHSYDIVTNDATVAKKATMTVNGSSLGAGDTLTFDGSSETNGHFTLVGGAGDDTLKGGQNGNQISGGQGQDTLTGGSGDDVLTGGGAKDVLDGGANGNDVFVYNAVSDSSGIHFDTVLGFDVTRDAFDVTRAVTGIDAAISAGTLNGGNAGQFNSDLAAAVDAAHLAAGHAVLFTPDSGSLAGDVFLVVDQNGIAGYQANQDLVIEISGSANIASLAVHNFM